MTTIAILYFSGYGHTVKQAEALATGVRLAGAVPHVIRIPETGDLTEAAARLFDLLRAADRLGRPIAVAPIPRHGLGLAINDRLARAAAPREG